MEACEPLRAYFSAKVRYSDSLELGLSLVLSTKRGEGCVMGRASQQQHLTNTTAVGNSLGCCKSAALSILNILHCIYRCVCQHSGLDSTKWWPLIAVKPSPYLNKTKQKPSRKDPNYNKLTSVSWWDTSLETHMHFPLPQEISCFSYVILIICPLWKLNTIPVTICCSLTRIPYEHLQLHYLRQKGK